MSGGGTGWVSFAGARSVRRDLERSGHGASASAIRARSWTRGQRSGVLFSVIGCSGRSRDQTSPTITPLVAISQYCSRYGECWTGAIPAKREVSLLESAFVVRARKARSYAAPQPRLLPQKEYCSQVARGGIVSCPPTTEQPSRALSLRPEYSS
jgi:hypothetical protein